MPYNQHFWKQVQEQSSKKPRSSMSAVYNQIIEAQYTALYGKSVSDSGEMPTAPEGFEAIATIPTNELSKLKIDISHLSESGNKSLIDVLMKKVGLKNKKHLMDMGAVLKNLAKVTGYANDVKLYNYLSQNLNGLFNLEQSSSYNVIEAVKQNIPQEIVSDGLDNFLKALLIDDTKFASTNVGPGEFYMCLFSNAKVAGEGGAKSGDLFADGISYELKGTGARMEGDGYATRAFEHINSVYKLYTDFKEFKALSGSAGMTKLNLTSLVLNSFKQISKMPQDSELYNKEALVKIIAGTNNYPPNDVKGYDLEKDLSNLLPETEELLNYSEANITKIIGAMHLVSYAIHNGYGKLALINNRTGSMAIFDSPKNLDAGLTILNNNPVKVDTNLDVVTAKMIRAKSAAFSYLA